MNNDLGKSNKEKIVIENGEMLIENGLSEGRGNRGKIAFGVWK